MSRILAAICVLLLHIVAPLAAAQADVKPTIAIVQFGENAVSSFVVAGVVNTLYGYGYIQAEELGQAEPGHPLSESLEGAALENLNLHFFNSDYDFAALQFVVDGALDSEPDIVIAFEEIATLSVLNATANMEEPPVVLFAAVPNPYSAGIADASCLKPAHVTGTHSVVPYDQILPMYLAQNPELQSIGVIFSSNEGSSRDAAEQIAAAGEAGVPVFTIGMDGSLYRQGALIGISFNQWYDQGGNLGRIAAAWLDGQIDIAETGISTVNPMLGYTVNEVYANQWGIELAPEIMEAADVRIAEGGRMQIQTPRVMQVFGQMMSPQPLEARQAADQAFIESIRCTAEMIAEQQAELEG